MSALICAANLAFSLFGRLSQRFARARRASACDINKQLRNISDSEHCEFVDISTNSNWNPKTSMETTSFLYSMGFVRPLSVKRPVYNLVRAIYFAEA